MAAGSRSTSDDLIAVVYFVLTVNGEPMKAQEIAAALRHTHLGEVRKRDVNRVLYGPLGPCVTRVEGHKWVRDVGRPLENLSISCTAYALTSRQREAVLGALRDRTFRSAMLSLECLEQFQVKRDADFLAVFNTDKRKTDLKNAIEAAVKAANQWQKGFRRDRAYEWVVSDEYLSQLDGFLKQRILGLLDLCTGTKELRKHVLRADALETWLPYVSLQFLHQVPHIKERHYAELRLALERACKAAEGRGIGKPWDADFSVTTALLPLEWLYACDPRPCIEALVNRLKRSGFTNVGHLAVFHPEAFRACRAIPEEEWLTLARAIRS